jgi:2-oxoglutarate ferredoxin oxidoreductase subunit beta
MGNPETPFNLPLMAIASGATYVARWTTLHTRELADSVEEALLKRGFSFIEVLSPYPVNYGRRNKQKLLDMLKMYQEKAIIKNGAPPFELDIDLGRGIILGKFADLDRRTWAEQYDRIYRSDNS